MYFRKYFAGTVTDWTESKTITPLLGTLNTALTLVSNVTCSAIQETLLEAGIECEYDENDYLLNIDGVTVQIYNRRNINSTYTEINCNGHYIMNSGQLNTFSNNSYKFYVTLIGDIDGLLKIAIGSYANPSLETNGFVIGKGVDLKDGANIRIINTIPKLSSTQNNAYILKNNQILSDCSNEITFGWQITNKTEINNNGTEITLVEAIAQTGRFKLNNCYFGNAALTEGYFYNIGGDIYYYSSNNILVKCKTETKEHT